MHLALATVLALSAGLANAEAQGPLPVPGELVALAAPEGQHRLLESKDKLSYWQLAGNFETQRNQAYCSVASSVIVLNALGVPRPVSSLYPDYRYFTQQDFFRGVDPMLADPRKVATEGMTLDQLSKVLAHFPVKVSKYPADSMSLEQFRALVEDASRHNDRFLLLNFNRPDIGEIGGGHWSPVAAYHAPTDSVLLMDVARYKYPPLWIPLTRLYEATQHIDSTSGKSRGALVVGVR